MADWTVITDSQVDPDAPLTSELAYAWRDNVIAAFEGAVGAPRLEIAALSSGFVTAGGVGSYMWARRTTGTGNVAFGGTLAGSSLSPTAAAFGVDDGGGTFTYEFPVGSAQSGTWRCMGNYTHTINTGRFNGSALWLRIS